MLGRSVVSELSHVSVTVVSHSMVSELSHVSVTVVCAGPFSS